MQEVILIFFFSNELRKSMDLSLASLNSKMPPHTF